MIEDPQVETEGVARCTGLVLEDQKLLAKAFRYAEQ